MGRLRRIKNDYELVKLSPYYFEKPFSNNKDSYLEIGMGKGDFIISSAIKNKEINYYGIDKFPTVICKAIRKLELFESKLNNLQFIICDVSDIFNYLNPKFINKIFLNFSDPWPKKRHEKRRLTSNYHLDIYKKLLVDDGNIELKTDNVNFFKYTLGVLTSRRDIKILIKTKDLYKSNIIKNNIQTEYERKFVLQGKQIFYIRFKFV